eukprot:3859019-Pleurochrysis_carterae.AAC.1
MSCLPASLPACEPAYLFAYLLACVSARSPVCQPANKSGCLLDVLLAYYLWPVNQPAEVPIFNCVLLNQLICLIHDNGGLPPPPQTMLILHFLGIFSLVEPGFRRSRSRISPTQNHIPTSIYTHLRAHALAYNKTTGTRGRAHARVHARAIKIRHERPVAHMSR